MSFKRKLVIKGKTVIGNIILFFLFRAFRVLSNKDTNIKKEIDNWEEKQAIEIKTGKDAPQLTIQKHNSHLEKKQKEIENPDLLIEFKSLDSAFLLLTGRLGVAQAYAEHRFTLKGDISQAMSFVRCIDIVESYLFPYFITKRILKEKYKRQTSMLNIYFHILINQ